MTPPDSEIIDRVAGELLGCRNLLFVTGAGMSADSGLPTYRGVGGLYEGGATEEGHPIEEMLSGEMFARRPEWTWKYLRRIERACRGATFNRGHAVIAEMERHFPRVWTLTQNVDGFHRAAGSRNVIAVHGELRDIRCTVCTRRETVEDYSRLPDLPRCPSCNAVLRPDVVLFGETLGAAALRDLKVQLREFDLVFSIGTTSMFPYIAFPVALAVQRERPSVEINPLPTRVSSLATYRLALKAAEALEAIWARYQERQASTAGRRGAHEAVAQPVPQRPRGGAETIA